MKWIIDMPDGWNPEPVDDGGSWTGKCVDCPFRMARAVDTEDYFCFPGNCPLGKAVKENSNETK